VLLVLVALLIHAGRCPRRFRPAHGLERRQSTVAGEIARRLEWRAYDFPNMEMAPSSANIAMTQ
jgi:hypothetical protein